MTSFAPLVQKELSEVVREKRLPVFALAFASLGGILVAGFLGNAGAPADVAAGRVPVSALAIVGPLFFLDVIGLVMLSAVFTMDAVSKERDAGMLGLLLTTTATPGALVASKLALSLVAYAIAALLGVGIAAVVGLSLGGIVPLAIALAYAGPLLALHVFLAGTSLLLSVLAPNGRVSVALGVGLSLPLFLLGATPLFQQIAASWPAFGEAVAWTPFAVAASGLDAIVIGTPTPIAGYAVTVLAGVACAALAFLVLRRQEVAQG